MCVCVKYERANSSEYLLTALLSSEQAGTSSQLLSTSADGVQQLRNIEIQSMNGKKKKKTVIQNPSSVCVCNTPPTPHLRDVHFLSLPTTKPVTSSWKRTDDLISDLIAFTVGVDLSPRFSAPFSPFLRNNARIKAASGEDKIYILFGKIPVFSIRVFDTHARVR